MTAKGGLKPYWAVQMYEALSADEWGAVKVVQHRSRGFFAPGRVANVYLEVRYGGGECRCWVEEGHDGGPREHQQSFTCFGPDVADARHWTIALLVDATERARQRKLAAFIRGLR